MSLRFNKWATSSSKLHANPSMVAPLRSWLENEIFSGELSVRLMRPLQDSSPCLLPTEFSKKTCCCLAGISFSQKRGRRSNQDAACAEFFCRGHCKSPALHRTGSQDIGQMPSPTSLRMNPNSLSFQSNHATSEGSFATLRSNELLYGG